jgi:diaminohydroxyphosphoribosylaminopyrimidine deaminase/5-amino-6-(5-phosphoribosylamino)uracil reductase
MQRALDLAAPHHPHPNPRVGAVVVDESGAVVGEGAHLGPGHPHAEVVALGQAGARARGATVYVSLEPCTHHGRTPPCVDAIVAAGVQHVVLGAVDPDHRVSGHGMAYLRASGIDVVVDGLGGAAEALDPGYFHHRRTGLPRITMKLALTIDGSVAARDGSSQWITSDAARADAHALRAEMDAVLVGAGTLRVDDPLLTARHQAMERQPRPVIVAGAGPLPGGRRVWDREPIVVAATGMEIPSGELLIVSPGEDGWPDPEASVRALADSGLYDLLLEGGPSLAGSWWRAGVVARGVVYIGARIGGGQGLSPLGGEFATMAQSRDVTIEEVRRVGPDVRIEFS